MAGRLQNEDFKTQAELIAAGGAKAQLLNDTKVYVTANSINDTLDQAILTGQIGSGGSKNYLANPKFTIATGGIPNSWSVFKTTLTSQIPTGSIGAADAGFTITQTGTTPLEGLYSGLLASTGVLAVGNGLISNAFTIDREDQAKVMGFSFYYEAISGTMSFAGTTANTWAVYIYDVTNSAWIQPAGVYNLTQGSGVGLASGTFQTTSNSTQYRIALVCITATSGAVSLKVDDFQLGPQKVVYGSPVTDWQSYTGATVIDDATGSDIGSYTVNYFYARRVGDSLEIKVRVTSSADRVNTNKLCVTFPNQFQINTTGIGDGLYGTAVYYIPATGSIFTNCQRSSALRNGINFNKANGDQYTVGEFDNGSIMIAQALVPISGLSSSVQMSNDTDTRVVATRAGFTCNTVPDGATGKDITRGTIAFDTHGAWSGDEYIVPVSGIFRLSALIAYQANWTAGEYWYANVRVNGSDVARITTWGALNTTTVGIFVDQSGSVTLSVNAGDRIRVRIFQDNLGGGTKDFSGALYLERLSGPATIAASETVAASYSHTAGQQVNTEAYIDFSQKNFDTHNMYTAGSGYNPANPIGTSWTVQPKITIPVSGKYLVNFTATTAFDAYNISTFLYTVIYKNGTGLAACVNRPQATFGSGSHNWQLFATQEIQCNAGDIIQFSFGQLSGGARFVFGSQPAYTHFELVRVGN
jgi:hypothetical protein